MSSRLWGSMAVKKQQRRRQTYEKLLSDPGGWYVTNPPVASGRGTLGTPPRRSREVMNSRSRGALPGTVTP
jgi:hypothetical protein